MKISFYILVIGLVFITSCSSDSVDCDVNSFNSDIQARVNDVNAAGTTYANDPTEENCNTFKDAANAYLDAVQGYSNCDQFDQVQYDAAVQGARDAVNQVPCN